MLPLHPILIKPYLLKETVEALRTSLHEAVAIPFYPVVVENISGARACLPVHPGNVSNYIILIQTKKDYPGNLYNSHRYISCPFFIYKRLMENQHTSGNYQTTVKP